MSFIKRNNFLVSLKLHQKVLLTLLSFLFLISIWFFFIYSKIENKITKNKNSLHQIIKKKQLLKNSKQKCKKIAKKINLIKSDINNSTSNKDPKTEILAYAKTSGIELKSYSIQENKNKKKSLNKQKAFYEFTGNKNQTLAFCKKLKQCKKALKCEETSISTKDNNTCNLKCVLEFLPGKTKKTPKTKT